MNLEELRELVNLENDEIIAKLKNRREDLKRCFDIIEIGLTNDLGGKENLDNNLLAFAEFESELERYVREVRIIKSALSFKKMRML